MTKKKRKDLDSSYNPRKGSGQLYKNHKKKHEGNLLAIRSNTKKVVTLGNKEIPKKTSIVINYDQIIMEESHKEKLKKLLEDDKVFEEKNSEHRPCTLTSNKTVETPGKTTLYLTEDRGIYKIFTNENSSAISTPKKDKLKLEENDSFYDSSPYKNIKKPPKNNRKFQSVVITKESLQKAKRQIDLNPSRSQNKTMLAKKVSQNKGSATTYMRAVRKKPFKQHSRGLAKYEWGHMIPRSVAPNLQSEDNLVCITSQTNTKQMVVDNKIKTLSKTYPEGFIYETSVELIPKTHAAHKILTTIKTPLFTLPFTFFGQDKQTPDYHEKYYTDALIDAAIEATKSKKKQNK